jgi:hydrogenase nickel incorporation protein HypB
VGIDVTIKRAIYEENDARARAIHEALAGRGVFAINVLGGPGAGKTSLIKALAERIVAAGERVAVIEGDLASDIDTRALRALGIEAYQIETGGDCHLNAAMIEAVLPRMRIEDGSWLFIENIGNLVCPAEFVIGEDIKVVVVGVAEGSDKPYKYPFIFNKSAACVLSKIDLKSAMGFDEAYFEAGLASAAPGAELLPLNGRTGEGADEILGWLRRVRDTAAKAAD